MFLSLSLSPIGPFPPLSTLLCRHREGREEERGRGGGGEKHKKAGNNEKQLSKILELPWRMLHKAKKDSKLQLLNVILHRVVAAEAARKGGREGGDRERREERREREAAAASILPPPPPDI